MSLLEKSDAIHLKLENADDYFFSTLPVVQKRIAQGGVRLAAILNKIFGESSKPHSS